MLNRQQQALLNPFQKILEKDRNFLWIKRESFIDLDSLEDHLHVFEIGKTKIELWDYKKIIHSLFEEKISSHKNKHIHRFCDLIKKDILSIIDQSFSIDESVVPFEFSLREVKGVPCTKLHADFLPLRLICTYFGEGTLFLPSSSTRYPCLNEGRPNKRVHIKNTPSYQAKDFDLLLLKGRKFNKGEMRPCAHRSPELDPNKKRLVLKVDFK